MPDGREEPKAQALVGKRARVGKVRRAARAQKVWRADCALTRGASPPRAVECEFTAPRSQGIKSSL